jgi:hypothetical protein
MGAEKMEDAICVFDGNWKLVAKWDQQSKAHKKWAFMNGTVSPVALFDLADNPSEDESKNLLSNPEHKPRVERMIRNFYNTRDTEGSGRTTPTEY